MGQNIELSKSKQKQIIIDQAVTEYVDTPLLDRSIKRISAKYGINEKTLSRHLKARGVEIVKTGPSVNFNYRFFQNIDSEEKAYWLGFMYADGYVMAKTNGVGLGVALKDIDHLKKYNLALNYPKGLKVSETHQFGSKEHANKDGKTLYMVRTIITNKWLKEDLIACGCVPNKSLILTFPSEDIFKESEQYTKEQLILHFIRGYFDGDGTLGLYPHSRTNPTLEESLLIVGTKDFLEGVQKYLGKGYLMQKPNCNEATYRLGYSTSKAFNAAEKLYKNATVYLDRKYNKYLDFCHHKSSKNGKD